MSSACERIDAMPTGNENREELKTLLPHASQMLLLSGCEPETSPGMAVAWVEITDQSPFFLAELDGVPGCIAIEYMAQTMALHTGREKRRKGQRLKIGFVLGSRSLSVKVSAFRKGEKYRISAVCTYSDESFGSFSCKMEDGQGNVVASGEISAFQPDEDATPGMLKEFS